MRLGKEEQPFFLSSRPPGVSLNWTLFGVLLTPYPRLKIKRKNNKVHHLFLFSVLSGQFLCILSFFFFFLIQKKFFSILSFILQIFVKGQSISANVLTSSKRKKIVLWLDGLTNIFLSCPCTNYCKFREILRCLSLFSRILVKGWIDIYLSLYFSI